MTQPDPEGSVIKDGVEIPLGKGQKVKGLKSTLLYNEYPFLITLSINGDLIIFLNVYFRYIVYDIAQVNVKYLLKMKFKYL